MEIVAGRHNPDDRHTKSRPTLQPQNKSPTAPRRWPAVARRGRLLRFVLPEAKYCQKRPLGAEASRACLHPHYCDPDSPTGLRPGTPKNVRFLAGRKGLFSHHPKTGPKKIPNNSQKSRHLPRTELDVAESFHPSPPPLPLAQTSVGIKPSQAPNSTPFSNALAGQKQRGLRRPSERGEPRRRCWTTPLTDGHGEERSETNQPAFGSRTCVGGGRNERRFSRHAPAATFWRMSFAAAKAEPSWPPPAIPKTPTQP